MTEFDEPELSFEELSLFEEVVVSSSSSQSSSVSTAAVLDGELVFEVFEALEEVELALEVEECLCFFDEDEVEVGVADEVEL